jgi:hypothetical protein
VILLLFALLFILIFLGIYHDDKKQGIKVTSERVGIHSVTRSNNINTPLIPSVDSLLSRLVVSYEANER